MAAQPTRFAATLAAGSVHHLHLLAAVGSAFVAFCLAGSGVALVDAALHPDETAQPPGHSTPAAPVPVLLTAVVGVVSSIAALTVSATANGLLVSVTACWIGLRLLYVRCVVDQPVLDISVVSCGFLLRAIAGGVAADIALSQWFLLITAAGSLFLAAGKRDAELALCDTSVPARRSLTGYTGSYLPFVWSIAAAATVICYGLWAFGQDAHRSGNSFAVSMIPFTVAVLRCAVDIDAGTAADPEAIALGDRILQMLALASILTVAVGIYR